METVPVELARWATTAGLPAVARATAALEAGEEALAIATTLRRDLAPDRAAFVLTAAVARRRAVAAGVAGAEHLVLTREAAEQASHPVVAAWRAARATAVEGYGTAPLVDLCAGTGADAVALAAHGPVVAVEVDPGRAVLAAHRAAVLDVPVEVVVGDALAPPVSLADRIVHADPDRRDRHGRRARSLDQHRPPVGALLAATAEATASLLTVAPGTPWDDPDLPAEACLTFVEHDGRLVEAVLETGTAATARARAVLLPSGLVLERDRPSRHLDVGPVGTHLLVPATAAVRARLHDEVGRRHGARRLADRRALLTADAPVDDPFLTSERVLAVLPPRPRAVRAWLRDREGVAEVPACEVLTHGIDHDPVAFLRAADARRGPDGLRIHLVRRDDDGIAIVTDRRDVGPSARSEPT